MDVLHRLLSLNEHKPAAIPRFIASVRLDTVWLKLIAETWGGKGLAAEPMPGTARDERTEEQKAIGKLLPAWPCVVEKQMQGRLL